jgi:MFS family permease
MLKLTILSLSLLMVSPNAVSVALADIAKSFPEVSYVTITLILTLPSLIVIPFSLISGFLSSFVKKRTLVITGLILMALSGMAPIVLHNLYAIITMRAIFGVGLGILIPFLSGLIACFFDGKERNQLFGFQSATINMGQVILSLIAGFLTLYGWSNVFWVYAITLPILLLIAINLPEPEKPVEEGKQKVTLNKAMFLICFLAVVLGVFVYVLFVNTANFVIKESYGDASTVGMILTACTLTGLVCGLFFSKIYSLFKGFTSALGCVCFGLGYLLLSTATGLNMVFPGAMLVGAGQLFFTTYLLVITARVSDKSSVTLATALLYASVYFGQFLSPIVMINVTRALGDTSERFTFLVCAVALLAEAVLFIVSNLITGRKKQTA